MSKYFLNLLTKRSYRLERIALGVIEAKLKGTTNFLRAITRLDSEGRYLNTIPEVSPAEAISVDWVRLTPAEVIALAARNDSDWGVRTAGKTYVRSEMAERAAKAAVAKRARKLAKEFGIRLEERKGSSSKCVYIWAPERVYASESQRWGRPKAIPGGYSPAEPRRDPHNFHSAYGWDKAAEMICRYIDDMRLGASGLDSDQSAYLLNSTDPYVKQLLAAWFAGENVAGVLADYLEEEMEMGDLARVLRSTVLASLDMIRAAPVS